MQNFKIYKVGGAVRDKLLGIPNKDNDYVVVGATVEDMIALGYKPVGKDFPVFLHPITHEEYALARTERKSGIGYKGFRFYTDKSISIEEDLKRRDLTINAIAEDESGNIIDPYGGVTDLKNKLIRHVSDAFTEDPLRVMRTARFAARFNFNVASETMGLIKLIANQPNELKSLSKERIQTELDKAVEQTNIVDFFKILFDCTALNHILVEFCSLFADTKLLDELQLYLKKCEDLYLLKEITIKEYNLFKMVLLYYTITQYLSVNDALSIINKTTLTNQTKELLVILIKLYPQLVKFNSIVKNKDAQNILSIFNALDPLRKPSRFKSIQQLTIIISKIKNTYSAIQSANNFINKINKLFKEIDYRLILPNNNAKSAKEIVYNKKLDIIVNTF